MSTIQWISSLLVLGGLVLLLLSAWTLARLLKHLPESRYNFVWKLILGMHPVFVIGYILTIVIIFYQVTQVLTIVIGIVYLGGALFTLFVSHTAKQTLNEQEELQRLRSESMVSQVLDYLHNEVTLHGTDLRYLYANPATNSTIRYSELIGITPKERCELEGGDSSICKKMMDEMDLVIRTGQPRSYIETHERGRTQHFLRKINPIYNEGGEVIRLVNQAINVTDLQESREAYRVAMEASQAASEAKMTFIATISHELRTPMNSIINGLQVIEASRAVQQDEETSMFLDLASRASSHLELIINDLLDFSKIATGRLELVQVPISIKELVELTCSHHFEAARSRGINVEFKWDPTIPGRLLGDELRTYQIISNVLSNAVKFTERGKVSLHAKLVKRDQAQIMLQFKISDTGIGITADKQERIYDAFHQVDGSHTRTYEGTGLGLAIVKKLIEILGGYIWLDSREGRGTTFTVLLPFTPAGDLAIQAPDHEFLGRERSYRPLKAAELEQVPDGMRILLVYDMEPGRELLERYLKPFKADTNLATNSQQAMEMLQKSSYDLVIIDLHNGQSQGLLHQLRSWEKTNSKSPTPVFTINSPEQQGQSRETLSAWLYRPLEKNIFHHLLVSFFSDRDKSGDSTA
jgi:signal transduction histidine kinase